MKIATEVLGVLSALHVDGNRVRITEQLDRKLYEKTNKVLEAIGGAWNRGAKAHVFGSDPVPRLDLAIVTGEVETGQDVGHFETPESLAATLVVMARVSPGHTVLEPSAGGGRLVRVALAIPSVLVTAIERDLVRRAALKQLCFSYANRLHVATVDDFMDYDKKKLAPAFDRVIMNPPFCKVGKGDHLDHVEHAFGLLKPGGVLVSVLPSSVVFRRDRRYITFRKFVKSVGEIVPLPEGSFKESGTGVNTVTVTLEKTA